MTDGKNSSVFIYSGGDADYVFGPFASLLPLREFIPHVEGLLEQEGFTKGRIEFLLTTIKQRIQFIN